jgi:tRNA(Ile)-lysidine synthase
LPFIAGKEGIQEKARALRYSWFEEIRKSHGYSCIATAHQADDVAETVLFNLFRGTGVAGLHGILPVRGHLIRPLLPFTKEALLHFAQEQNIAFREDRSNRETIYTRNKIRLDILPAIRARFPQVVPAIAGTAQRIQGAEIMLERSYAKTYKKLAQRRGADIHLPVKSLVRMPEIDFFVYRTLQPLGFSTGETVAAGQLLFSSTGKRVDSERFSVIRHGDFLIITPVAEQEKGIHYIEQLPAQVETTQGHFSFSYGENEGPVPASAAIACLDADRVEFPLSLRKRRDGDYFYPLGMGGKKKKISRFLSDLKVPAHQREDLWIVQSGEKVIWLAGYRIDERFKISDRTGKVIRIEWHPHENPPPFLKSS